MFLFKIVPKSSYQDSYADYPKLQKLWTKIHKNQINLCKWEVDRAFLLITFFKIHVPICDAIEEHKN